MNLFPALVTGADGTVYQTCRVLSGPEGTVAYWWDREIGDARAVVTTDAQLVANAPNSRHYTLATEDGTVHVSRTHGCGCGHPMKRWRLPKPVREGT